MTAAEELAARWRSFYERAPKEELRPLPAGACAECLAPRGFACSSECMANTAGTRRVR